jgi:hypothetical protein
VGQIAPAIVDSAPHNQDFSKPIAKNAAIVQRAAQHKQLQWDPLGQITQQVLHRPKLRPKLCDTVENVTLQCNMF